MMPVRPTRELRPDGDAGVPVKRMDEFVPFGSRSYALMFLLLFVSRGMDFLSTWVATPNMVLEGNPIAKKLGWKWGIPLNVALCFGLAFWPLPAIVISTTSVLVAARNFQSAWLMRSLGEQIYRDWHIERVQETSVTLYLFCLFAQTALTGGVGAAVIYFSEWQLVPLAIGLGIVAYALAVAFYTLLGIWRMRRSAIRNARLAERKLGGRRTPASPAEERQGCRSLPCRPPPSLRANSPAPYQYVFTHPRRVPQAGRPGQPDPRHPPAAGGRGNPALGLSQDPRAGRVVPVRIGRGRRTPRPLLLRGLQPARDHPAGGPDG